MAVDLATKSLLHDKLRFFITVSGVAFAVTLVFVQVGLFIGLMSNASLTISSLPGGGTTVVARIPVEPRPARGEIIGARSDR